jgi:hypothetical protein
LLEAPAARLPNSALVETKSFPKLLCLVTILCDYGNRYQSKLYNPTFLREKGLPVPAWLERAPSNIPTVFEDA